MLNAVVNTINQATRTVVQRHPNRQQASIFRPVSNHDGATVSNTEVYGGLGVLDAIEDTEHVMFEPMGDASVLIVKYPEDAVGVIVGMRFEAATVGQAILLIEPDDEQAILARHDMVMLLYPEFDTAVAYELVNTESNIHIAGGTRRYVCEPRDELSHWFSLF